MTKEPRAYGRVQAVLHLIATTVIILVGAVLLYRLLVDGGRRQPPPPTRAANGAAPLRSIHPFAAKGAEAAECAGDQEKFWEMHDSMFANQKLLDEPSLRAHAARLGLDVSAFSTCLGGARSKEVEADEISGRLLGVTGTPTFFLGLVQEDGRVKVLDRFSGAGSVEQFRIAIDRVLASVPAPAPEAR